MIKIILSFILLIATILHSPIICRFFRNLYEYDDADMVSVVMFMILIMIAEASLFVFFVVTYVEELENKNS